MNWEKSEFKKIIGITHDHFSYIDKIRKKKSKSGKLKEIIDFYKKHKETIDDLYDDAL